MSKAIVTIAVNAAALLPAANAAFASILVTLTDSTGAAQQASVTGAETPPFTAEFDNVAAGPGSGTVTAQAIDSLGAAIGDAINQTFTEVGTAPPPPATFPQPVGITVTVT